MGIGLTPEFSAGMLRDPMPTVNSKGIAALNILIRDSSVINMGYNPVSPSVIFTRWRSS